MQKVSIIIVNYNGQADTLECLVSLENADFVGLSVQVVVVDNGSKEKFVLPYRKSNTQLKKFQLEVLRSEVNLGFTGGNNLGIRHAFETHQPEYVLLLNNDTLVEPDFLTKLVTFADTQPNVAAVCPLIYFAKGNEFHKQNYDNADLGKVVWFAGGSIDWKNMYAFHRGVDEVDRGQFGIGLHESSNLQQRIIPDDPNRHDSTPQIEYSTMDFATGCCVLFPSEVLKKVGLFDDAYFLYWEDVDLSWRIKQAGFELYFHPESKISHKNAGSSGGSGSQLHKKYQERNRKRFAMKYAPLRTKLQFLKSLV